MKIAYSNMSDHVRKMDWQFNIPKTGKVVGTEDAVQSPQPQPQPHSVGGHELPQEQHIDSNENNAPINLPNAANTTTAPVDFDTVQPITNTQEEYQPVNPFADNTSASSGTVTQAAHSTAALIDQETGLEIPDYMKPFISDQ